MKKQMVFRTLDEAVDRGAQELRARDMHGVAHAIGAIKDTTVAIGSHVRGWEKDFGAGVRPITRRAHDRIDAGFYGLAPKRRKRKATKKQLLALKRARKMRKHSATGRIRARKTVTRLAAHQGKRTRRTPKQMRAIRRLVAANRARARSARGGTKRKRARKSRK
jgi:hypothetical protein